MSNLGIGVMLNMLGGNEASVAALRGAIGKTIAGLRIEGDNELRIEFTDGTGIKFTDEGQSCCERRYMRTDDDLSYHIGATLSGAEIRDAPSATTEDGYEDHDVQFLAVQTSKGEFVCSNHNEHNGYYGGFAIEVEAF